MLHMVECGAARLLWTHVFKFCTDVLETSPPGKRTLAIIFNLWSHDTLGTVEARALIRHAFGRYYADSVAVAMQTKTNFSWQYTYRGALRNLEHAVRRYGQSVRLFTTWRQHTSRQRHVPEEALTQFKHLITFQPGGKSFQLTPAFQRALSEAENMIAQYQANQTADRRRQGQHRQGTQRRRTTQQ